MPRAKLIFALGSLIALDQISKSLVPQNLIIKNSALPPFALTAVLFLFFLVFYFRFGGRINFGFILITAGAVSNLADRIYFSYVRDFISIRFATMNLADLFIWAGIIILLLKYVKKSL